MLTTSYSWVVARISNHFLSGEPSGEHSLLSFSSLSLWNSMAASTTYLVIFVLVVLMSIFVSQSGSEALRPSHWIRKMKQVHPTTTSLLLSSKASLESSLQWWEDLAPPFAFPAPAEDDAATPLEDLRPHEAVDVVHFCFLVHGYRGYSRDLSYLQTVMQRVADTELRKRVTEDLSASQHSMQSDGSNASSFLMSSQQDVVVHAAVCNERRTDDGVVSGGDRLVAEMRQVIHAEMQRRQKNISSDDEELPKITISMLGNSLGGLYARYAIAKLLQHCEVVEEETSTTTTQQSEQQVQEKTWILDGKYRLCLNIFCTTATPHLGVAGHTFLPIPRTAEVGFAQVMRSTGRDLFRCNDLLRRMATTAEYLEPLGHFRQRIAYANAYGTDFPVPCQTAGFLNEESSSPHYFYEENNNDKDDEPMDAAEAQGLIIAKVYTPRRMDALTAGNTGTTNSADILESNEEEIDESKAWAIELDKEDELKIMSQTLDTLGWKKVFVDARKNMPKIPLFGLSVSRSNSSNMEDESNSSSADENDENMGGDDRQARSESIALLKQKGVVESRHLASAVTAPLFDENFHWPVGHNMIVAFSRSRLSTYLNKAGRPVVDSIAKNLVKDILDWPVQETAAVDIPEKVAA